MAAILLGRVELRVDRQQFRNNMKIQESRCAVSRASLSRIGTGRHGGRPSQEPEAKPLASRLIPRFCSERVDPAILWGLGYSVGEGRPPCRPPAV